VHQNKTGGVVLDIDTVLNLHFCLAGSFDEARKCMLILGWCIDEQDLDQKVQEIGL
jgi:hypothetical protein